MTDDETCARGDNSTYTHEKGYTCPGCDRSFRGAGPYNTHVRAARRRLKIAARTRIGGAP